MQISSFESTAEHILDWNKKQSCIFHSNTESKSQIQCRVWSNISRRVDCCTVMQHPSVLTWVAHQVASRQLSFSSSLPYLLISVFWQLFLLPHEVSPFRQFFLGCRSLWRRSNMRHGSSIMAYRWRDYWGWICWIYWAWWVGFVEWLLKKGPRTICGNIFAKIATLPACVWERE